MRHPQCPEVSITLRVNEHDLEEYEDEEEHTHPEDAEGCTKIVRYVESVVDANFSVEMRLPAEERAQCDWDLLLYFDGTWVGGAVYCDKTSSTPGRASVTGFATFTDGQWSYAKYAFAPLHTTDGSAKANLKHTLAKVGEIKAVLRKCVRVGSKLASNQQHYVPAVGSHVPGKALKGRAVSTRTTLNNHEPCAAPYFSTVTYPWGEQPVGVYTFMYRSRRDLQIEGLIPRDIPLLERDPNTLTLAEARERIRLQEAQLREAVKIKKEKRAHSVMIADEDDENDNNETMTAAERRAGKRNRLGHGSGVEVVDLTED